MKVNIEACKTEFKNLNLLDVFIFEDNYYIKTTMTQAIDILSHTPYTFNSNDRVKYIESELNIKG